eukprot:8954199-Alexandrium_andersonii.AAC.1
MSASLVGSEMCIRDSFKCPKPWEITFLENQHRLSGARRSFEDCQGVARACLLYTSDAADDM